MSVVSRHGCIKSFIVFKVPYFHNFFDYLRTIFHGCNTPVARNWPTAPLLPPPLNPNKQAIDFDKTHISIHQFWQFSCENGVYKKPYTHRLKLLKMSLMNDVILWWLLWRNCNAKQGRSKVFRNEHIDSNNLCTYS